MNKFWGRNESNTYNQKFSRDDDQLLALNHENLNDHEYLSKLFQSENRIDDNSTFDQSNTSFEMSQPNSDIIDGLMSSNDLCEDVILFSDQVDFAIEQIRKRNINTINNILSINHDSYSSLIHKQLILYNHLTRVVIDRLNKSTNIKSNFVITNPKNNFDILNKKLIFTTINILEKQNVNRLSSYSIENLMGILLSLYQSNDNKDIEKDNTLDVFINKLSIVLQNSFIYSLNQSLNLTSDIKIIKKLIKNIHLSITSAYGLLTIGLLSKNYNYILISIANFVIILLRLKEIEDDMMIFIDNIKVASTADESSNTITTIDSSKLKLISKVSESNNQQKGSKSKVLNINPNTNNYNLPSNTPEDNNDRVTTIVPITISKPISKSNNKLLLDKDNISKMKSKPMKLSLDGLLDNNNYIDISNQTNITVMTAMVNTTPKSISKNTFKPINNNNQSDNDDSSNQNTKNSSNKSSKSINTTSSKQTSNQLSKSNNQSTNKSLNQNTSNNQSNIVLNKEKLYILNESIALIQSLQLLPKNILKMIAEKNINLSSNITTAQSTAINQQTLNNYNNTSVYSCGQNSYGELGHIDSNSRKLFTKIQNMDNKNICSLGAGNEHSVLLSKSGKIYVCGYNENGQCGIGSNQSVKIPTIIHGVLDVENVTQIHAYNGCEHTIAITSDGKLYSFGYNLRGQLGLGGANSEFVPRLVKSLLSRKVVMASCSYHHSFFLCSDNSIYSCGRNDSGQLGLGDCTDRKTPQLVTSNITQHTINSMSCGQYHSMLLTSNNKVFVCGKNDYGQLGLDNVDSCYVLTSITVPFLDVNDSVTSICCGYYHSLLLTSCSMIYGFGRNDDGQLGLGHSQLKIQHITPILSLRNKNCKQISAGCYHTIVITSNGMLYVFGRNKHGQLGTGDLDERHYPHPVDDFVGKNIITVAAGFYHTLVLVANDSNESYGFDNEIDITESNNVIDRNEFNNNVSQITSPQNKINQIIAQENTIVSYIKSYYNITNTSPDISNKPTVALAISNTDVTSSMNDIATAERRSSVVSDIVLPIDKSFSLQFNSKSSIKELILYMIDYVSISFDNCLFVKVENTITLKQFNDLVNYVQINALLLNICRNICNEITDCDVSVDESIRLIKQCLHNLNNVLSKYHNHLLYYVSTQISNQSNINNRYINELLSRPSNKLNSSGDIIKELTNCIISPISEISIDKFEYIFIQLYQQIVYLHVYSYLDRSNEKNQMNSSLSPNHYQNFNQLKESIDYNNNLDKQCSKILIKYHDLFFISISKVYSFMNVLSNYLTSQLSIDNFTNQPCNNRSTSYSTTFSTNNSVSFSTGYSNSMSTTFTGSLDDIDYDYQSNYLFVTSYIKVLHLHSNLCMKYRNISDVLTLFKNSFKYSICIYKLILSVYLHLTNICINRSVKDKNIKVSDFLSNYMSIHDIYKSIGILEHCCCNFMKISLPVIMSYKLPVNYKYEEVDLSTDTDVIDLVSEIDISIHILIYIIDSSLSIIDLLSLSNELLDDVTIQYNNILTNLLPTLLLYGISVDIKRLANGCIHCILDVFQLLTNKLLDISAKLQINKQSINFNCSNDSLNDNTNEDKSNHNKQDENNLIELSNQSINLQKYLVPTSNLPNNSIINSSTLNSSNLIKKDNNQFTNVMWHVKLLKLSTMLQTKLTSIYFINVQQVLDKSDNISQITDSNIDDLISHSIWQYIYIPTDLALFNSDKLTKISTNYLIGHKNFEEFRSLALGSDGNYKAIYSSAKSSKCLYVLTEIENNLFDICLSIYFNGHIYLYASIGSIQRFVVIHGQIISYIKHIYNQRTKILTNNSMTWLDILKIINESIHRLRYLITAQNVLRFAYHPLNIFVSKRFKYSVYWKRAVSVIIICNRWRKVVELKFQAVGHVLIDFVSKFLSMFIENTPDDYSKFLDFYWDKFVYKLKIQSSGNYNISKALVKYGSILENQSVPISIKCDSLICLISTYSHNLTSKYSSIAKTENEYIKYNQSINYLCDYMYNFIIKFNVSSSLNHQMEIYMLSLALSWFYSIILYHKQSNLLNYSVYLLLSKFLYQNRLINKLIELILQLDSKIYYDMALIFNNALACNIHSGFSIIFKNFKSFFNELCNNTTNNLTPNNNNISSNTNNDINHSKAPIVNSSNKKSGSIKEKSKIIRKTSHLIVSMIQYITLNSNANATNKIVYNYSLIVYYHIVRLIDQKNIELQSNSNSSSNTTISNNSVINTNPNILLQNNVPTSNMSKAVDISISTKRRYQDIITKPLEFSKSQDGLVIQGDQMITSFKGVDFTLSTWMYINKKSHYQTNTKQYSFITGKVNHNDAWPLVLLRSDGKLEIIYGHGSDIDRFTTQGVIPHNTWFHIAVVIESKKIKVFINGLLDSYITTNKGNGRAILYPLLIGTCPNTVRTRVDHIRDGFDGILSNYKYYTRALSPIHVKAVFEQGPPELFDIKEKWIYHFLSSLKLSIQALKQFSNFKLLENIGNISPHENSNFIIIESINVCIYLFQTEFTSSNIRYGALNNLTDLLLLRPSLDQTSINLYNNIGYTTINYPNFLPIHQLKCLSSISSVEEKIITYFLLILGICNSPSYTEVIIDQLNESSIAMVNSLFSNDVEYNQMKELFHYIPIVITNLTIHTNKQSSHIDSYNDLMNELSNNIVNCLHKLYMHEYWKSIICNVLICITNNYLSNIRNNISMYPKLLFQGITSYLGRSNDSPILGSKIIHKYANLACTVVNINRSTNLCIVLSNNIVLGRYIIYVLKYNELVNHVSVSIDCYSDILPNLLLLVEYYHNHVKLLMYDSCYDMVHYNDTNNHLTNHLNNNVSIPVYLKHILLRYLRPIESYSYYQIIHYIYHMISTDYSHAVTILNSSSSFLSHLLSNSIQTIKFLPNYLLDFLIENKLDIKLDNRSDKIDGKIDSKLEKSNYLIDDSNIYYSPMKQSNFLIMNIHSNFLLSYKYILTIPDKSTYINYPCIDNDTEKCYLDFISKSFPIVRNSKPMDKYMKSFSNQTIKLIESNELVLITDWISSDTNCMNKYYNYGDVTDKDFIHSLQYFNNLRHNIILLSRYILNYIPFNSIVNSSYIYSTNDMNIKLSSQIQIWQVVLISSKLNNYMTNDLHNEYFNYFKSHNNLVTDVLLNQLVTIYLTYNTTNLIVKSDLFYRLVHCIYVWLTSYIDSSNELELLLAIIQKLRPVYFHLTTKSINTFDYLVILISKYVFRRIYRLITHEFSAHLSELTIYAFNKKLSNTFTLLRSQIIDYLSLEKGKVLIESNNGYILNQFILLLELIYRSSNHCIIDKYIMNDINIYVFSLIKKFVVPLITTNASSMKTTIPLLLLTPPAIEIKFVQSNEICIDCHHSVNFIVNTLLKKSNNEDKSDSKIDNKLSNKLANLPDYSVDSKIDSRIDNKQDNYFESSIESTIDTTLDSNDYNHQLIYSNCMIEIAIAPYKQSESCIYSTIYVGQPIELSQSNLIPGSTYLIRCRIIILGYYTHWSLPIEFKTDNASNVFIFDKIFSGPDVLISSNGLVATYKGDENWSTILGSHPFSNGKSYWEIKVKNTSTAYLFIGVATSQADLTLFLGGDSHGYGYIGEQALYHNREKVKIYGDCFSSGDIIGVSLDLTNGILSYTKNQKPLGNAFTNLYGEFYPAVAFYNKDQELEIISSSYSSTCSPTIIPISLTSLNHYELSLIYEMMHCLHTSSMLSYISIRDIVSTVNEWCSNHTIRVKIYTGRYIYLSTKSLLLNRVGLSVNERVRTPYGTGEVIGTGFNRIWFKFLLEVDKTNSFNIWYFSEQQIYAGRDEKYFLRTTYHPNYRSNRVNDNKNELGTLTNVVNSVVANRLSNISTVINSDEDTIPLISPTNQLFFFDIATISDYIDMNKWTDEMDSILLTYISNTSSKLNINPWNIPIDMILNDYRLIQTSLLKVISTNIELSYKWGITGPKRKAVIARIGFLRHLNHHLEVYLPVLLNDSASIGLYDSFNKSKYIHLHSNKLFGCINKKLNIIDDSYPIIVSSSNKSYESKSNLSPSNPFLNQTLASNEDILLSTSWSPLSKSIFLSLDPILITRKRILLDTRMQTFWSILTKSSIQPSKIEDDYDYPENLPQVKINRIQSFRSREASELLRIPGEDLFLSSMFYQLYKELRRYNQDIYRISYTHPMDDSQIRSFKIKFDGEGVDDYGGPYREVLQQICDELQFLDPSITGISSQFHSTTTNIENHANSNDMTSNMKCYVPLLHPTTNWNNTSSECLERYKYTFHPSSISPVYLDLYRFLGQLIGIAIRSRITLDLQLPSYIWKIIVNEIITENDLASIDYNSYQFIKLLDSLFHRYVDIANKSTSSINLNANSNTSSNQPSNINNNVLSDIKTELLSMIEDLTFVVTLSNGQVVDLIPNGSNINVTIDNIHSYINKYVNCRLLESQDQIRSFKYGLESVIPKQALSLLTGNELEILICGIKEIDISRLRHNTEYDEDVTCNDKHIQNFWNILEYEFTNDERSLFLRFVWARPTLPPRELDFPQKFKIQSAVGDDVAINPDSYLPKAHTCFFSINLPKYSTKEIMIEKLKYAINNCTEMDADFRLTDTDIVGWGQGISSAIGVNPLSTMTLDDH